MTSTQTESLKALRARYQAASDRMVEAGRMHTEATATNDRVLRNSRVPYKRVAASTAMFNAYAEHEAATEAFRQVEDELQQAESARISARGATRYAWRIVFGGNRGESLRGYDRLIRTRDEARDAARRADGCGLKSGAFARRVRISQSEYEKAFKAA